MPAQTAPTFMADTPSGVIAPALAAPIFERARQVSVAQQLGQKVTLGPTGTNIPVSVGKPQASWVAEGALKPATEGSWDIVTMVPKKMAVVTAISMEALRTDPLGYWGQIKEDLAEAFAIAFDAAVIQGTNSPFTTNLEQTTKAVEIGTANAASGGVWADLNAGLSLLVNDNKRLTGFAFDDRLEPTLNAAVTTQGQPLFVATPLTGSPLSGQYDARTGQLMNRPVAMASRVGEPIPGGAGTYTLGYGGDWTQVAWGQVNSIRYSLNTQGVITLTNGTTVNLWQQNLTGLLAEAEYGFVIKDPQAFVKYTETKS